MATKQRYGKLGGNVAYHGYQSFRSDEVTPEGAYAIGLETARRMWGKDYKIVLATHLNTDNLHYHIVVNSVSFRTGRKFENHISDPGNFRRNLLGTWKKRIASKQFHRQSKKGLLGSQKQRLNTPRYS